MKSKIFLTFAIFSLVILIFTFFLVMNQLKKSFYAYNHERLQEALLELEREFISAVQDGEETLMSLVSRYYVIEKLREYKKSYFYTQKEEIRKKLIEFFYPLRKNFSLLRVYLPDHKLLVDMYDLNRKGELSPDSPLLPILEKNLKANFILKQNGNIILALSAPIFSSRGKKLGVLLVGYDINKILEKIKKYTGFDLYFVEEDREQRLHLLASTLYFYSSREQESFLKNLQESNGAGFVFSVRKLSFLAGKVRNLFSLQKTANFLLIGSIQTFHVDILLEEVKRTFLIIFLLAILFSVLGSWLGASKITEPLLKLRNFAEELSRGEYGKVIEIQGNDELSVLADTFNQLSLKLEEKTKKLEQINSDLKKEVEKLTQELSAVYEELATTQKLSLLGFFAAGVVHEIKNPLSTLKGTTTYLKNTLKKGNFDYKYLDTMAEEIDRLQRLSFSLTSFLKSQEEERYFSEIAKQIEEFLGRELERKKIKLKIEIKKDIKLPLGADKVKQILINLIKNSVEALEEKGGSIFVVLEEKNGEALLTVADSGKGIPKEHLDHIFKPFFTVGKKEGTGLGLSLVKKIVEDAGGTIKVESAVGKGTVFKINLPLSKKES